MSPIKPHIKLALVKQALAAAIAITLLYSPAIAQTQKTIAFIPLAAHPQDIPGLGISLSLPERAYTSISTVAGAQTSAIVFPGKSDQKWQMAIKSHTSSNAELTNEEALHSIINQLKLTKPVRDARKQNISPEDILNKNFEYSRIVITDYIKDLTIAGVPAERVYLSAPTLPDYPDAGITIFNPSPGKFLLVHMECPHGTLADHKLLFETISASVVFKDASEINAKRATAVLALDQLFSQVNAEDLESLMDESPQFFRLFRPSASARAMDDEDVAWQRISIRTGQAGEINPGKARTKWSAEDRAFGFILQIDARALLFNSVVDSQGIFFLSRDRQDERWSLRNTVRKGRSSSTTTQTLVRKGDKLSYVVERPGKPRHTGEFAIPPRGYLSKIESALLPRLIATRNIPGDFAYYAFDPGLDTIVLKYESFESDGDGNWNSELRHVENSLPHSSIYDSRGRIMQRVTPDGQRLVPIESDRLRKIWAAKDLPID